MPPGTAHCVLSTEPCFARGGHYLHDDLLDRTAAVSMLFRLTPRPPTNAFHNSVLQLFVARKVQLIMHPWRMELQRYCRRRARVEWATDNDPVAPPWPEHYPVDEDDMGGSPEWIAMLYLVRYLAPRNLDQETDWLPFTKEQVDYTVEKAELFVEFWTKRSRSTLFAATIEAVARRMLTFSGGNMAHVKGFPQYWRPKEGEDYPPSIEPVPQSVR